MKSFLQKYETAWILIGLALLALVACGKFLFAGDGWVLATPHSDILNQFIPWREFTYRELSNGNLPLWNPHIFGGAPFLAGFQSAMFYPPNWIHFLMPVETAINWIITFHVFLCGVFMFFWTRLHNLHPLGCVLAAICYMFGASTILHISAGHLPNISSFPWIPLILLCIDRIFLCKAQFRWTLIGSLACALFILAGHPQYVYFSAIGVLTYSFVRLILTTKQRRPIIFSLACMGALAIGIAAVQIFPYLFIHSETARGQGLTLEQASVFHFPIQNLISSIFPKIFGGYGSVFYWGYWNYSETCIYIGIPALSFAFISLFKLKNPVIRASIICFCLLLLLSFGSQMPWYQLIYDYMPGISGVRGMCKFILPASVFLIMISAYGFHYFINDLNKYRKISYPLIVFGILLGGLGLYLRSELASEWWSQFWDDYLTNSRSGDIHGSVSLLRRANEFGMYQENVCDVIFKSSFIFLFFGSVILFVKKSRYLGPVILTILIIEMSQFALSSIAITDTEKYLGPAKIELLKHHVENERMAVSNYSNLPMSIGLYNTTGNDPTVMARYSKFLHFTQHGEEDGGRWHINPSINRPHPLLSILRLSNLLIRIPRSKLSVTKLGRPLKRAQLMKKWELSPDAGYSVLYTMANQKFDPFNMVILEEDPGIVPILSSAERLESAKVVIRSIDTDTFDIEVKSQSDALLLVTENYAKDWKAHSLVSDNPQTYRVIPANYFQIGIPLKAGTHKIRLEYSPTSLWVGAWLSGLLILLVAGALLYDFRRHGISG